MYQKIRNQTIHLTAATITKLKRQLKPREGDSPCTKLNHVFLISYLFQAFVRMQIIQPLQFVIIENERRRVELVFIRGSGQFFEVPPGQIKDLR